MDVGNRVLVVIFAADKSLLLDHVSPIPALDLTKHDVFLLDVLVRLHGRVFAAFATSSINWKDFDLQRTDIQKQSH